MIDLDITQTNAAIERLLERTENPRHRFLLQTYHRHRALEIAGRYEEIFAPEMTVEHPVYNFYTGGVPLTLSGRDTIKDLYALWTQTSECIFYAEDEQLAVGDDLICSNGIAYQQHPALSLVARGHLVDDLDAHYLRRTRQIMIWGYDERGRMIGENVWEIDPSSAQIIKLAPGDVLNPAHAAKLLASQIVALPAFDAATMGPPG